MYALVGVNDTGEKLFYDVKNDHLAVAPRNNNEHKSGNSKSHFGIIALFNVLISSITIPMRISLGWVLAVTFLLAISTVILLVIWNKKPQTIYLNKYLIRETDLSSFDYKKVKKDLSSLSLLGIGIILLAFCLCAYYYFNSDYILLLLLIWSLLVIGVFFQSEAILSTIYKKNLEKKYRGYN